jgi:hypothetical protein
MDMFDEPNFAIKERFFSEIFKPYLKHELRVENYYYFLDQSWTAWLLGVKKKGIKNMLFVEWICEQLYKDNPSDFSQIVSYLLDQVYDAQERITQSENGYHEARSLKEIDIVKVFSASLRHYKVFFESEFRLWSTIPYFFVVTKYGKKSEGSSPDTFVEISASTKYQTIKDIKVVLPKGDLHDLIEGFDSTIRNAGEGHDRYEFSDDGTVILHDIDPHTGKPKGKKVIELTQTDITNLINTCRKSIWILRNGAMLFIVNNPDFAKVLNHIRPMKFREIEYMFKAFSGSSWFKVNEFSFKKDSNILTIQLQSFEKHVGISSELILGNGERYDLVDVESKVKYKHQLWGVLQRLLSIWPKEPLPNIDLKILDNKGHCLSTLTYSNVELKKLLEGKNKYEPIPSKGTITEEEYIMVTAIRVPYGSREFAERLIEQRGHKVRKLPT